MQKPVGKIEAARRMAGITNDAAAQACCLSRQTITQRSQSPDSWRLGELKALSTLMDADARAVLLAGIQEFFLD